jgi:hypothetical protein
MKTDAVAAIVVVVSSPPPPGLRAPPSLDAAFRLAKQLENLHPKHWTSTANG